MSYSLVQAGQLPEVYELYRAAINEMHARNLYQWVWGEYPNEDILQEDVALGRLYRLDAAGRLTADGRRRFGEYLTVLERIVRDAAGAAGQDVGAGILPLAST